MVTIEYLDDFVLDYSCRVFKIAKANGIIAFLISLANKADTFYYSGRSLENNGEVFTGFLWHRSIISSINEMLCIIDKLNLINNSSFIVKCLLIN